MDNVLKKIKQRGYWKVVIRPTMYFENLINLNDLKSLIDKNKVSLRGWDYPHANPSEITKSSPGSIQSICNWDAGPKYEYWRFYQSGQFVHYFSMREDYRISSNKIKEFQEEYGTESTKFLEIILTIYSFTEIFEFAKNLFSDIEKVKGVEIIVEIYDVIGRTLVFWDTFSRTLYGAYTCHYTQNYIQYKKITSKEDLLKNSNNFALDAAIEIFKAFEWYNPKKEIFIKDQDKLLKRTP